MTTTYFVSDGYNADGAPNPLREVEVIKWPEPDSANCLCRIKYRDDGYECFAPKYSLMHVAAGGV